MSKIFGSVVCWFCGHKWYPCKLYAWGIEFEEAYTCKRCGKYEEE